MFIAIAAIAAAAIGAAASSGDKANAMALAQAAADKITGMGLPPDQSKALIYQQLQQGGHLTPDLESALAQENFVPSTVSASTADTSQLQNTLNALKAQSQGGLTAQQMANQQQLLGQTNASTQAQMKGLLNQQAQQGKTGSGATLAGEMQAIQGGAQQNSQNALQIGAQGQQAQQAALANLLQGQSGLRAQDIGMSTQNAQMAQQANMFQAQNSAARQARNVASQNAANQTNLARTNYVNDANTQMANQEALRQEQAQRQYWLDQLAQNQGAANAMQGLANTNMQAANNTAQSWGQIGQGLTGAAAAYYKNQNNTPATSTASTAYQTPNDNWSGFTANPNAGQTQQYPAMIPLAQQGPSYDANGNLI